METPEEITRKIRSIPKCDRTLLDKYEFYDALEDLRWEENSPKYQRVKEKAKKWYKELNWQPMSPGSV